MDGRMWATLNSLDDRRADERACMECGHDVSGCDHVPPVVQWTTSTAKANGKLSRPFAPLLLFAADPLFMTCPQLCLSLYPQPSPRRAAREATAPENHKNDKNNDNGRQQERQTENDKDNTNTDG